ncbi:MAG TPA: hypothetical protein PKE55_09180 [Kiritimatiellia bacterium]|nr:hypothetical protein [Kiritimatiellia bacterium]
MKTWMLIGLALVWMGTGSLAGADPASDPRFFYHRLFKRISYSEITRRAAEDIRLGRQQPLLPFVVKQEPPSIFVHFEIRPDRLGALIGALGLPPGFQLVPIPVLEGDDPRFLISLNIYAVEGLGGALSGNRAEWSVYVSKDGGRPSFMVVEARASVFSLDSVNWFTRGTTLTHARGPGGIQSFVAADGGRFFQSVITTAGLASAVPVFASARWAAANDRIYWTDGVADRVYYDGLLVDTPLLSVAPSGLSFTDTTRWREFVFPEPVGVQVFQTALEFVISPWYNVDR